MDTLTYKINGLQQAHRLHALVAWRAARLLPGGSTNQQFKTKPLE